MPTVIDSLIVKLGLDSGDFNSGKNKVNQGLKETGNEAEKTGAKFKKTGKDGADGFETVTKSAIKFLAVIAGTVAVKRFIEQMIDSNAAINRFSRNIDESISNVSAWSNATEIAGGSAEGLQGTMDMLSKSQTELMLTGQSSLLPYLTSMGIGLADVNGKARPVSDLLLDLADRFGKMDRTTANNMGRMMGIDQGTMNLLLKGRVEVERLIATQKEFGAVTKTQADIFEKAKIKLVTAWLEITAAGRAALAPILDFIMDHGEVIKIFFISLAAILATAFAPALYAAAAGVIALVAPVIVALSPFLLLAAAVTGLYKALELLFEEYEVWKKGGQSLIPWEKWKIDVDAAKAGIASLIAKFTDLKGAWAAIKNFFGFGESPAASAPSTPAASAPSTPAASAPSTPAASAPSSKLPRGIRNNNPGNLNFAGQRGASKEGGPGGRFAVFGSMQEGVAALVRQIGLYVKRGKDTIRKIIGIYAPSFENDTGAYINAVSKSLGIGPDDPLDVDNADQVMGLVRAIATHESGKGYVTDAQIAAGYKLSGGIKGASRAAVGAGASKVAMAAQGGGGMIGAGSSSETHIGEIKVYTQATDAEGIAADIGQHMDHLFTAQANSGLS